MIILTGDTHGEFSRIFEFCEEYDLTEEDVLVILGDAGINYYLNERDQELKEELSELPCTLFLIHGNHEERPENVPGYEEMIWHGGKVLYEPEYPNLIFAQDGEIYDFNGKKAIAIGGAYSVDKYYRLNGGMPWFDSEQPDEYTKRYVESRLEQEDWKVDYVLSHTTPLSFEPREEFLPCIDQDTVDRSTEEWLEEIEHQLDYDRWFAGHFHTDRSVDRVQILFEDFLELDAEW